MDQAEINNWKTIAEKMEASGDTESWFYLRARAIADGKQDPMPTVSELMPKSAWLETMGCWSDGLWNQERLDVLTCSWCVKEEVGVTPFIKPGSHAYLVSLSRQIVGMYMSYPLPPYSTTSNGNMEILNMSS